MVPERKNPGCVQLSRGACKLPCSGGIAEIRDTLLASKVQDAVPGAITPCEITMTAQDTGLVWKKGLFFPGLEAEVTTNISRAPLKLWWRETKWEPLKPHCGMC